MQKKQMGRLQNLQYYVWCIHLVKRLSKAFGDSEYIWKLADQNILSVTLKPIRLLLARTEVFTKLFFLLPKQVSNFFFTFSNSIQLW